MAAVNLTTSSSEETTNFSRVVCMLFDLGPQVMSRIMDENLPGRLRFCSRYIVVNFVRNTYKTKYCEQLFLAAINLKVTRCFQVAA